MFVRSQARQHDSQEPRSGHGPKSIGGRMEKQNGPYAQGTLLSLKKERNPDT